MSKGTVDVNPELFGAEFKGRARISAVITRADGTREDLGVIAETDNRPLFVRLKSKFRALLKRSR